MTDDTKAIALTGEREVAMRARESGRTPIPSRPADMKWLEMSEADLMEVMRNSLYPGAADTSIRNVIAYCKAGGLNLMLKPVHIVPMYVRPAGGGAGAMRDVIMPGINHYRTQASRSGEYMGMSLPEWGPMVEYQLGSAKVAVPEWCRITVRRMVQGVVCDFPAEEYWIENYASAGRDKKEPNAMWGTRGRGQLAKVTEAQALRKAFPEFTEGGETVEEMAGKAIGEDRVTDSGTIKPEVGKGAAAQLDRFAGKAVEGEALKVDEKPKAKAKPKGEEKVAGVGLPIEETGEVPRMDADAENAWLTDGKWAKGWRWINEVMPTLGPKGRQALAEEHAALLWAVSKGSPAYATAALDFVRAMGVRVPEPANEGDTNEG